MGQAGGERVGIMAESVTRSRVEEEGSASQMTTSAGLVAHH
jgi:hypothetical protein